MNGLRAVRKIASDLTSSTVAFTELEYIGNEINDKGRS